MRAFIIDDEISSRNTLKALIKKYCPEVEIVGEAENFTDGVLQTKKAVPDILFLDINLGRDRQGFDVLDSLKTFKGNVIFVTAYQDFAYKAFQYANVVHYLLKPLDPIELVEAVGRVAQHSTEPKQKELQASIENKDQKVAVPYKNGIEMIPVHELIYLKAHGSYCRIYMTGDKVITISKNMKFVRDKLISFPQFIKTHKSYIVNIMHIGMYLRSDGGKLELSNKDVIPVSISFKPQVLKLFQ